MSSQPDEIDVRRTDDTFDSAPIGIAHVGIDGSWLRVNGTLCAILGYSREELLRLTVQAVTHPKDREQDLLALERLEQGEIASHRFEKRYVRKDGSLVWADLQVAPQRDAHGEFLYFLETILDISRAKQLERKLRHGRLQVNNFISTLVHELRNPLNQVSVHAELARQTLKQKGDIQKAEDSVSKIVDVVATTGEFLNYLQALSQTGSDGVRLEAVSLSDVLDEVLSDMQIVVAESDCEIEVAKALPEVLGHRASLVHVVQNLLDNSLKYRRPGVPSTISIHSFTSTEAVELIVRDNGRGIPDQEIRHILKPLRRGSNVEEIFGHGLGLALCRQLVESMHGAIEIASASEGTTVLLKLKHPAR